MYYAEFFKFLKKWREAKRFPPASGWPSTITLDKKAWEGIEKVYNLTNIDNVEYETSFFYLEGETYQTTPLRGEESRVVSNHTMQIKYEVDQKRRVYYRNVLLDGKRIDKKAMKPEKITKNPKFGFLFNIHTHPQHLNYSGNPTYGFFSDTDIRSLLGAEAMLSGLVTDKFWLVGKTENIIKKIGEVGEDMLREISDKSYEGEDYLDEIIRTQMKDWGLVFYKADFGKMLERVI
jgi:hypothetical protein